MATHTREELEDLKVDELKSIASDAEVEGYSSMRKAELVDAILSADGPVSDRPTSDAEDRTRKRTETRLDGEGEEVEVERGTVDHVAAVTDGTIPDQGDRTIEAGTIDPAVAERREARIESADERPGRVRPTPASIDPRLVDRREARRAEGRDERPATAPPTRG